MPNIVPTNMQGPGDRAVTETTLDGSTDTFDFNRNANPVLILRNPTAGALTPTFDGDGAGDINVQGAGVFDISAGYTAAAIPAGDVAAIPLNSIRRYLAGTIAINNGSGLIAQLLEF